MKPLLFAAGLSLLPVAALAAPDAVQTAAICGTRTTCKVEKTRDAGKSPAGASLTVVELRLGLADKPKDQDEGCIDGNARDGGVEYWLLDGTAPPRQVLQLCNDGYGMAGVGEDEVEVGPNRLVHRQSGGSSWRWSMDVTYSLIPFRAVTEQDCSYHNVSEQSGTLTDIDYRTRRVRALAKDSTRATSGSDVRHGPGRRRPSPRASTRRRSGPIRWWRRACRARPRSRPVRRSAIACAA